jgi:pimeloyl-ACP methyl ester carboxylesterase
MPPKKIQYNFPAGDQSHCPRFRLALPIIEIDDWSGNVDGFSELELNVRDLGTGRPIVVIPGLFDTESHFDIFESLQDQFRVLTISIPGFGTSRRPAWCDSIDDLANIFITYIENLGVEDVILIGFSLGGWVAAEIAVRRPQWLSRLVLVDSFGVRTGKPDERTISDIFAITMADIRKLAFVNPDDAETYLGTVGRSEAELLAIARAQEAVAVYGWRPYLHDPKLPRRLSRIVAPTLVVWGREDHINHLRNGEALAQAIPGAELAVIENAGHFPHLEQSKEFENNLNAFLRRKEKVSAAVTNI